MNIQNNGVTKHPDFREAHLYPSAARFGTKFDDTPGYVFYLYTYLTLLLSYLRTSSLLVHNSG